MSVPKFRGLTEYQECSDFARYLDRRGFLYTHVPLGGARDPKEAARLKAIGTKRGVPDFLIERGGTVSLQQKAWIEALSAIGWIAFVARGAREAIERMENLDPRE
jgi:hypothetical protein